MQGDELRRGGDVVGEGVLVGPLQCLEAVGDEVVADGEVGVDVGGGVLYAADEEVGPLGGGDLSGDVGEVEGGAGDGEGGVAGDPDACGGGGVADECLDGVVGEVGEEVVDGCVGDGDGQFGGVEVEVGGEGDAEVAGGEGRDGGDLEDVGRAEACLLGGVEQLDVALAGGRVGVGEDGDRAVGRGGVLGALAGHVGAGRVGVVDWVDQVYDYAQRALGGGVDGRVEGVDAGEVGEGAGGSNEGGAFVGGTGQSADGVGGGVGSGQCDVKCAVSSEDIGAAELEGVGGVELLVVVLRVPRERTSPERFDVDAGRCDLIFAYFLCEVDVLDVVAGDDEGETVALYVGVLESADLYGVGGGGGEFSAVGVDVDAGGGGDAAVAVGVGEADEGAGGFVGDHVSVLDGEGDG